MNFFATNLIHLRQLHKLKQSEIPDTVGFGRTTWIAYEKGDSYPAFLDLLKISNYFKVGLSDLVERDLTKEGNLNVKGENSKKREKGKLKGNPKGNLNDKFEGEEESAIYNIKMPQVITIDTQGNENVVLVPVRARAGYLNGYADPEFMAKLPAYRLPGLNNGTFRLFEVEGLSMYPTLHGGDLIIGSNVEQLRDVRDDRIYVVVTKSEGVVVKRVLNRIDKDGKLILKSDNYKDRDMYPPIVSNPENIIEIWYATGYISRQMRPPAEMYNRLIDLEGRLTLLEDGFKKQG